jgi:protein SCO1/2
MNTTASAPETRNVLYYKFPAALILGSLLAVTLAAGAEDCCKPEKPAAKPDACCAAMETAAFTKDSLYQADVAFTNDAGERFALGELRGRPVVLTMFFASCGYACPLLTSDMESIRAKLPADLRDRAAFVLVSFDTQRDTPAALRKYRNDRALDGQWILARGSDDAVRELAALLGVKYQREADGNFSHSNLVTILNAEGEIVHQRSGLKGGLDEAAAALAQVAQK